MRAAVLERFGAPLELRTVEDPTPAPGEVVVRTRASSLCRTDLKIIDGDIPTVELPRIIGHECAGEVVAAGPGVGEDAVGRRVTVGLDISCGSCPYCRVGETEHCLRLRRLGLERDGAHAEFVRVPAANLVDVPETVPFPVAATIADAVASPYRAVTSRGRVRIGESVAVYGLGGLGLVAVQVAAQAGGDVVAIARTPERRRMARELGAAHAVDPRDGDLADLLRDLTAGLGVHVFLDFVGIEGTVEQAVRACRKGGRVVVVGYVVPRFTVTTMRLVYDEVAVLGSRGASRAELTAAVGLVAAGRVRPVVAEEVALEDVNGAYARLRTGEVIGRAVVTMP